MARFSQIEERSGIHFYEDCGYLGVAGQRYQGYNDWCKSSQTMVQEFGSKMLTPETIPAVFPFLQLPSKSMACYEEPGQGAGYLSPRKLVAAQK